MLEQPRRRKKNVVEGGSLGKRGEQVSGRTQEIVKRWEREPGEVNATVRNVNKPPVGNSSSKTSGKTAAGQSRDNARANIVSGWNRKPGDVKATTKSVERRNISIQDRELSPRTIQMYDRAFKETAADRTAAHANEKKQAEARAREEAARRAQQAARGRR